MVRRISVRVWVEDEKENELEDAKQRRGLLRGLSREKREHEMLPSFVFTVPAVACTGHGLNHVRVRYS